MGQVNNTKRQTWRQRQAQATRDLIIEAARELFLQKGYVASTIEAIAARSGVAVSTIYFAFGSKRSLLREIRQRWHEVSHIREMLNEARTRSTAEEKIELLAHGTRRQWETSAAIIPIFQEAAASDREAAQELKEALRGRRAAIEGFVAGLESSLRSGISPADASAVVRALCRREVYEELVRESDWSPDTYEKWLARALKTQLLAGAGTEQSGSGQGAVSRIQGGTADSGRLRSDPVS